MTKEFSANKIIFIRFEVVCFTETEFFNEEEEVVKHIKRDGIKIY